MIMNTQNTAFPNLFPRIIWNERMAQNHAITEYKAHTLYIYILSKQLVVQLSMQEVSSQRTHMQTIEFM